MSRVSHGTEQNGTRSVTFQTEHGTGARGMKRNAERDPRSFGGRRSVFTFFFKLYSHFYK
jgi:hypothetical protein